MDEKEDIKIEELFSYGMSEEGFKQLLSDLRNAVSETKKAIDCTKLLEGNFVSEEGKAQLAEAVSKANEAIEESETDIEELFNRILSDWEKGDTNE